MWNVTRVAALFFALTSTSYVESWAQPMPPQQETEFTSTMRVREPTRKLSSRMLGELHCYQASFLYDLERRNEVCALPSVNALQVGGDYRVAYTMTRAFLLVHRLLFDIADVSNLKATGTDTFEATKSGGEKSTYKGNASVDIADPDKDTKTGYQARLMMLPDTAGEIPRRAFVAVKAWVKLEEVKEDIRPSPPSNLTCYKASRADVEDQSQLKVPLEREELACGEVPKNQRKKYGNRQVYWAGYSEKFKLSLFEIVPMREEEKVDEKKPEK